MKGGRACQVIERLSDRGESGIERVSDRGEYGIAPPDALHTRLLFRARTLLTLSPVSTDQYRLSDWLNGHPLGKVVSYKQGQ